MKTLREEWTDFFSRENLLLSQNYPGLFLSRFLLEVEDLLRAKYHPQICLDQSVHGVSEVVGQELRNKFKLGVPFAYLTQFAEFYHHKFYVNEDVLIPRQETEYLVDLLANMSKRRPFKRICDVGTGSGVILLSLLQIGAGEQGVGIDLSAAALSVARINSWRLRLDDRSEFIVSDRLKEVEGSFGLIVSNPPYIKSKAHRQLVHSQVEIFEPGLALFLEDNLYDNWFSDFFSQVLDCLEPGGLFAMEGHELELQNQAKQLSKFNFKDVQVIKDLAGLDRFLIAGKE